jgi:hypothetical protein
MRGIARERRIGHAGTLDPIGDRRAAAFFRAGNKSMRYSAFAG